MAALRQFGPALKVGSGPFTSLKQERRGADLRREANE